VSRRAVALVLTLALSLLAAPLIAEARQTGQVPRIGVLAAASPSSYASLLEAFRQGLRERGRSLVIEQRYSGGRPEHLPGLAEELARLNVDLIVSSGSAATRAAKRVFARVPVLFVTEDPVGESVVASMARPGGNVTGMALMNPAIGAKWVELLREALPAIRRVAILWDPTANRAQQQSVEAAARSRGLATLTIIGHQAHEIHAAFETAKKGGVGAVLILSSATLVSQRQRIVALAARHRMPAIYERRDFVEAGGFMSYGPDLRDVFRRLAVYADRILKGAKPADLPVGQPTKFELVINMKTAKALGLTIPPSVLVRADQVIE